MILLFALAAAVTEPPESASDRRAGAWLPYAECVKQTTAKNRRRPAKERLAFNQIATEVRLHCGSLKSVAAKWLAEQSGSELAPDELVRSETNELIADTITEIDSGVSIALAGDLPIPIRSEALKTSMQTLDGCLIAAAEKQSAIEDVGDRYVTFFSACGPEKSAVVATFMRDNDTGSEELRQVRFNQVQRRVGERLSRWAFRVLDPPPPQI